MLWSICVQHISVPYMNILSSKCYVPYAHILSFIRGRTSDKIKMDCTSWVRWLSSSPRNTGTVIYSSPFLTPMGSLSVRPTGSISKHFQICPPVFSSSAITESRSPLAPAWISEATCRSFSAPDSHHRSSPKSVNLKAVCANRSCSLRIEIPSMDSDTVTVPWELPPSTVSASVRLLNEKPPSPSLAESGGKWFRLDNQMLMLERESGSRVRGCLKLGIHYPCCLDAQGPWFPAFVQRFYHLRFLQLIYPELVSFVCNQKL